MAVFIEKGQVKRDPLTGLLNKSDTYRGTIFMAACRGRKNSIGSIEIDATIITIFFVIIYLAV